MSNNVVDAKERDKKTPQQTQGTEKTIYIGVFFDGTGNNKFQVMLGKLFRGKQAIATETNALGENGKPLTISEVRAKGRDYWKNYGTMTESQLDEIFFGYENKQSGENMHFIEDSIHVANLAGMAEEEKDPSLVANVEKYKRAKTEYKSDASHPGISESEWKDLKKSEGGDIQGSTYTNVVILEALYKSDNNNYFPIYVEGAGTDMSMGKNSGDLYKKGAGFGEGDYGVKEKVGSAFHAVERIGRKYMYDRNLSKLTVHLSIFGFSRGATEARMFAYDYNLNNEENSSKSIFKLPRYSSLAGVNVEKKLDFIGLFDTVSSHGLDFDDDVDDLHLYAVQDADFTLHLCAMDEFRKNFALTDIRSSLSNGKGLEVFMPGCHTDVGGGFSIGVDDWKVIKRTPIDKLTKENEEHYVINKWGRSGDSEYYEISLNTLMDMGWLSSMSLNKKTEKTVNDRRIEIYGSAYEDNKDNIHMKRYVKPGYSNIPLHIMHAKAIEKNVEFSPIPSSYKVNAPLLSDLLNSWKSSLQSSGRQFVKINNTDYRNLRSQYLHYSGNDSEFISDDTIGGLINSATYIKIAGNYKRSLITRKIIEGVQDSKQIYYLNSISANPAPREQSKTYIGPTK